MRRFIMTLAATALMGGVAASASAQDFQARSQALGKLTYTQLPRVEFSANELRSVVDFLSQVGGIDILAKWNEQGFGEGFDPTTKITLKLNNPTSLQTVLELVMKQATDEETTWVLGDGFVEIGTKQQLNKEKYVRIYPVRELLMVPPRFDNAPQLDLQSVLQSASQSGSGGGSQGNIFRDDQQDQDSIARANEADEAEELIDIITSIVEPNQWESLGGDGGSIRYFRGNLIINAADYLHRQVGGYPFSPARIGGAGNASANAGGGAVGLAHAIPAPRYVTLTGEWGIAKIVDIESSSIPVLVGGRVINSGGPGN